MIRSLTITTATGTVLGVVGLLFGLTACGNPDRDRERERDDFVQVSAQVGFAPQARHRVRAEERPFGLERKVVVRFRSPRVDGPLQGPAVQWLIDVDNGDAVTRVTTDSGERGRVTARFRRGTGWHTIRVQSTVERTATEARLYRVWTGRPR